MMSEQPGNVAEVIPQAIGMRILHVLIVTVLPVLCFSFSSMMQPQWQDGKYSSYISLLLNPQVAKFFFPFIIYPVICILILLISPQRFASKFVVRFGIYSGAFLAFQYVILLLVASGFSFLLTIVNLVVIFFSARILGLKIPANTWSNWVLGLGAIFLLAAMIDVLFSFFSFFYVAALWLLAFVLFASPALCFRVMLDVGYKLFMKYERPVIISLWRSTSFAVWLSGYTTAWYLSIQEMFKLYESLPKNPPAGCYVVTASAQGHPSFVGSQPVSTSSGIIWVNRQLQTLKCAELALQALAPGLHRTLRFVYDIIGPPLARRLTHPVLADMAYLSLKPAELLARFALRFIVPNLDEYASRLYR